MTPARLEPAAPRSQVKHSGDTTESPEALSDMSCPCEVTSNFIITRGKTLQKGVLVVLCRERLANVIEWPCLYEQGIVHKNNPC